VALPCLYGFRIFWGLDGFARPSTYPASIAQADRLMGTGPEKVLALPWHLYPFFRWTQGREVANPFSSTFRRQTIVGDNPEYGPMLAAATSQRSAYLQYLIWHGLQLHDFGNLIAPLGIKYVVLDRTVDWRDYGWLSHQDDLKLVRSWSDLALYENTRTVSLAYHPSATVRVADWGEVVGLAARRPLAAYAVTVERAAAGPIREPAVLPPSAPVRPVPVRSASPVSVQLARPVTESATLAEPFTSGWTLGAALGRPNLGVTDRFDAANGSGTISYTPWSRVRIGYLLGFAALALWLIALVVAVRRRSRVEQARVVVPNMVTAPDRVEVPV
jgi:hypothetical protein